MSPECYRACTVLDPVWSYEVQQLPMVIGCLGSSNMHGDFWTPWYSGTVATENSQRQGAMFVMAAPNF